MPDRVDEVILQNGTVIRHKVAGYEGRIDGTTEIKACFTAGGELLGKSTPKQIFQYRVAVPGESMRRIAPAEDLEILEGKVRVVCPACHGAYQSRPGFLGKPGGRCQCGEWICPMCLSCQGTSRDSVKGGQSACLNQRKRLVRKSAGQNKRRTVDTNRETA